MIEEVQRNYLEINSIQDLKETIKPNDDYSITLLNPVNFLDVPHYIFGQIDGTFDEGSIDNRYIPSTLSGFSSAGPNPGIIRSVVAYLKDNFGLPSDFNDSLLTTKNVCSLRHY